MGFRLTLPERCESLAGIWPPDAIKRDMANCQLVKKLNVQNSFFFFDRLYVRPTINITFLSKATKQ